MRIAVFDEHWATMGGGEKYAAATAAAVAGRHDVELLAPMPFDVAALEERLQIDLEGVGLRVIGDAPGAASDASADYDLFINASYASGALSRAPASIYVVFFPTLPGESLHLLDRRAARLLGNAVFPLDATIEWVEGFHMPEAGGRFRWTTGDGRLLVRAPPGAQVPVYLRLHTEGPEGEQRVARILVDGSEVAQLASSGRRPVSTTVRTWSRGDRRPSEIRIVSESSVPAESGLNAEDVRALGVRVLRARVGGPAGPIPASVAGRVGAAAQLLRPSVGLSATLTDRFLASYTELVSISEYSKGWTTRRWRRDSTIVFPPVTPHEPGDKEQVILAVGRFFPADGGHSKKQVELVHAFRQLVDRGAAGWELHLAGGYAPHQSDYLEAVRAASVGLPVHLHVNATGAELQQLYARAAIFWHAAGLGEHPERHPDRLEHFGITTVEAMSAGAVPIAIRRGGQLELFESGVEGFHFESIEELVELTRRAIGAPDELERMGAAARRRAAAFAPDRFASTMSAVVERTLQLGR